MVARFPLLILLCLVLAACVGKAPGEGCLSCHQSHYAERGSCVSCHRGNGKSVRKAIAHHRLIPAELAHFTVPGSRRVEEGKRLAERFGCRRCHNLGGKGTRLAADLDRLAGDDPVRLFGAIKRPVLFMPDFHFDDRQAAGLVNAVMAFAAKAPRPVSGGLPVVVHFASPQQGEKNIFEKKCGGCHRLLTAREGALGNGDVAPNLSGLFTPFYPTPFKPGEPWTPERLGRWLDNPRAVRPDTPMPPVRLSPPEKKQMIEMLKID